MIAHLYVLHTGALLRQALDEALSSVPTRDDHETAIENDVDRIIVD